MKGWRDFDAYLLSGLWHVHTAVTDGTNTIDELFDFAVSNAFPLIGFVEHIRRSPSYDFRRFYERVSEQAATRDIECAIGCEAKVLNERGELDVTASDSNRADIVYAAYHGTEFSRDEYVESVRMMVENPQVDVWAHPFAYAQREGFDVSRETLFAILERAAENDVLVEYNLRYDLTPRLSRAVKTHATILGYDLHDLDRWSRR